MLKTYQSRIRYFRAYIVCYVHIPNAICCKCGWMKKRALFQFTTGTFVMVEVIISAVGSASVS